MSSFLITNADSRWRVELNGVDITTMLADGGVQFSCREHGLPPEVQLTLRPRTTRADLPDALVAVSEVPA